MDPTSNDITPIAKKHGIILLLQFGSSVTGNIHEHSDVDLAVLLKRVPQSLEAHAELLEDLQQLFPGREIDLALLNRADPLFLKKITEACHLLHGSPGALQRLKIYAFKRYQDHRKYLAMERQYVERSLADLMIDPELITRKMVLIMADLHALVPLARRPLEDYVASATDEVLVERYLERIIGRMIDINYHLITEAGQPPPRDYFDSFTQLARIGVLPGEFATRIAACAGLRNRLVHEYDEIDPERVYAGLQVAVRDVPGYLRHVEQYLKKSTAG